MIDIILHGALGQKFGKKWNLEVSSVGEAIRAIHANNKEFKSFLLSNPNVFYKIQIGEKSLKYRSDFNKNIPHKVNEVHIFPVPMGAGGGLGSILQIVVGAALIVGGAVLLATGIGSAFGVPMILGGLALLATGVLGLLTPTPKFDYEDKSFQQSYSFGNVPNPIQQGDPIPLLYGEKIIPGLLIETKLTTTDA